MKTLCIGNNTDQTDKITKILAIKQNQKNYGLLSESTLTNTNLLEDGFYHTSVYDFSYGKLKQLAQTFDNVIILNQKKETYTHPDAYLKTIHLGEEISNTIWQNSDMKNDINFFSELVEKNKSFCIFPFIELLTYNNYTTVCCRSNKPITEISKLQNFSTDSNYNDIRNKMLNGELLPSHCNSCYRNEALGIKSARQEETVEWANKLNLTSIEDLQKIKSPVYYEVRPNNVCNLQCRMCTPTNSELINQEYYKLKIIDNLTYNNYSNFDIVDTTTVKKLYVAGGEPTAMPEFYKFLDKCIDENLNFEFNVNTNAAKFSEKFKNQLKKLKHIQFTISIDAFEDLNDYIRWNSNWKSIIDNTKYLIENGHTVSFNTTVSIYNVAHLYELFNFFDSNFPDILVHAQLDTSSAPPFHYPNKKKVIDNLVKIKTLNCYKNYKLLASLIDALVVYFENRQTLDLNFLQSFKNKNDLLDNNRNVFLKDYEFELWQSLEIINFKE